ncbi:hypothetical protein GCM10022255_105990 [Dactylosporangium darangshiense]|uniref:HNH/Endo VII superfamily nuclease toxins domain-containing protein n=1 Tax=Dactylosporangium darangshiense TaxID=579108 RepID=A0ABP8DTG6_9ACTN
MLAGNTPVLVHNDGVNYFPPRNLRELYDKGGKAIPDVEGRAHTQLGRNNVGKPSEYNAAHEFDENGRLVRQSHWSDHSDPRLHPNPHQHVYDPVTGARGTVEPFEGC